MTSQCLQLTITVHSQNSRTDRFRTPRAESVEVERERVEAPTPPSTHPNKNKGKYRAAPVQVSTTSATHSSCTHPVCPS
jgi:hypothetical protein